MADSSDKESPYPLYKRLASVLHESITSAQSCGVFSNIALVNGDNDVEKREEWNELVLKEGFEIVNVCISVDATVSGFLFWYLCTIMRSKFVILTFMHCISSASEDYQL